MQKGDQLFVRIDSRLEENNLGENDFKDHMAYVRKVAGERYFVGGGFVGEPGGMILFEAKDREEAESVTDQDPLIERKLYTYKLYEWEIAVLSGVDKL